MMCIIKNSIILSLLGILAISGILYSHHVATQAVEKGLKYCEKGSYDEAITEFNKAILLDPFYARAYNDRGLTYSLENDFDRAILDFNRSIELNPGDSINRINRAVAFYYEHEYARAWEDVHKAQSLGMKVEPSFLNILKQASNLKK